MLLTFGTIISFIYFFVFTGWLIATFIEFSKLTWLQQQYATITVPAIAWIAYASSFAFLLARIIS